MSLSIIAIIISMMSLVFTGFAFYYQHIRRSDKVRATILGISPNAPEAFKCVADIVFTNIGNRECSIVAVKLQWRLIEKEVGNNFIITAISDNGGPFTIKPNEVVSKEFVMGSDKTDTIRNAKKDDVIEYAFCFEIVDSLGRFHRIHKYFLKHVVGEHGFHGIGLLPNSVILLPSPVEESGLGTVTRSL